MIIYFYYDILIIAIEQGEQLTIGAFRRKEFNWLALPRAVTLQLL